jgi:plasmid maintenance system antidote protein VapI
MNNPLTQIEKQALHFRMDVADRIATAMARRNLSRSALADLLGCGKANISKILSGDENLTLDTISRLLQAVDSKMEIIVTPDRADEWDVKRKIQQIEESAWNESRCIVFSTVKISADDFAETGIMELSVIPEEAAA